jgi:putative PIN family toxin of toxin-antitoxin system
MTAKTHRIVVDTNLWVSMALGSKTVTLQMQQILTHANLSIFTSIEQLEELTETLAKPKLQKYLTTQRTQQLFELIWQRAQLIPIISQNKICRDPKDDFIINLALDAQAHCIVTGDADLLVLNPIDALEILTMTDFLQNVLV